MLGKIAIYLSNLKGGGAERAMLDIAKGIARRGVSTDLVLACAEGPYLTMLSDEVRLIDLRPWQHTMALPSLLRYLRTEHPDALISTLGAANFSALIAKRLLHHDLRVIVRLANIPAAEFDSGNYKQRLVGRMVKHLLPSAHAITVNSQETLDDLTRNYLPSDAACLVKIVNNPVVWPDHAEKAGATVEHPWFKDKSIPLILTAGRLSPQKDHATLLRAFAEVAKVRRARLVVLGEGDDRAKLTALAEELDIIDDVDFPGFHLNVFAYMAKASLFVLSSRYEAFANALVQTMACGTPVVSTDCPNGPRTILDHGKYGPLVPVGDWQMLAKAMVATLDNPTDPEFLIARAGEFSAESSIDQYMQLLSEVNLHCD